MRSRTSQWFEIGVRFEKTYEDGTLKKVTEQHVIEALSFTEAENRITKVANEFISGEFTVKTEVEAPYKELFFSDKTEDEYWYKVKLEFITIDEKSEREKRSTVIYLVQGANIHRALSNIVEVMGTTALDYEIIDIKKTKIVDVYEYKENKKEE